MILTRSTALAGIRLGRIRLRKLRFAKLRFAKIRFVALVGALLLSSTCAIRADAVKEWIDRLSDASDFNSERAASELIKTGVDALPALARASLSTDIEQAIRSEVLFFEIVTSFLLELENEYGSLELDRRELKQLRLRAASRKELEKLRKSFKTWKTDISDLDRKVETYLTSIALERKKEAEPLRFSEEDADKLARLNEDVAKLEAEIVNLDTIARGVARYYELESVADLLTAQTEVEELRSQDLEQRITEREPSVERLLNRVRSIGSLAMKAIFVRRANLPLRDMPTRGDLRSPLHVLYDDLLAQASKESSDAQWSAIAEGFERERFQNSWLWVLELERGTPRKERARKLLDKHLELTLAELDAANSRVRKRASRELYRLGNVGIKGLEKHLHLEDSTTIPPGTGAHGFLACLLRWRIAPSVYERSGMHFGDYKKRAFTARRRMIFQYVRSAGDDAIPTLRAIVFDKNLEESFLVKYAAAKALATQLDDSLGYLVLKSLHPDMVMKRPEMSRDLHIIQGLAHIRDKNYTAAIEEFSKILEQFPFDFEGNYHLAFAYLLIKNFPKSIHHFEIARRIRPKDQLTLYNLACAYALGGQESRALEALDASVDAGFYDADHMEKDVDLEPIRKAEKFRRIVIKARALQEK